MEPNNQNIPTTPVSNISDSMPVNVPMNDNPYGKHNKIGPVIAVLVIVLVLVVAALYLFAGNSNRSIDTMMEDKSTMMVDDVNQTTQSVQPVTNTADDVTSLEADLDSALEGLDSQNF